MVQRLRGRLASRRGRPDARGVQRVIYRILVVERLRHRSIVLCCGQGEGEEIELDATRILEKGLQESRRLEKTSARLFEFGKNNFDSITSARNRSLEFENRLVENRLGRIKSLISLYKSLGGGWNFEQAETAAEKTSAKQPGKYFAGNGSDNSR